MRCHHVFIDAVGTLRWRKDYTDTLRFRSVSAIKSSTCAFSTHCIVSVCGFRRESDKLTELVADSSQNDVQVLFVSDATWVHQDPVILHAP